jgi:hypothetical protein
LGLTHEKVALVADICCHTNQRKHSSRFGQVSTQHTVYPLAAFSLNNSSYVIIDYKDTKIFKTAKKLAINISKWRSDC